MCPLTTASLLLTALGICEHKFGWLSELGGLGACPSRATLKSWNAVSVVQTLCSFGRSQQQEFPLNCMCCARGGAYRMCPTLPDPYWYGYPFSCPMCKCHSTNLQISHRRNCFLCSWIFGVSLRGGKLRSLLCHHLGEVTQIQEVMTDNPFKKYILFI